MDPLGAAHVGMAIAALISGLVVAVVRKGTRLHARLGWVYVTSMAGLNLTALFIYRLLGGFGPFHAAAILSVASVGAGLVFTRRRKPRGRWKEAHAYWMGGSYVGLVAAAVAESTTRIPAAPFWGTVMAATLVVIGGGIVVLRITVPMALGARPARQAVQRTD